MITIRARLVRSALKLLGKKTIYGNTNLARRRRSFERNLKLLFPKDRNVKTRVIEVAGVRMLEVMTSGTAECTIVYLHGGGFVLGSPDAYQRHLARLAKLCNARVLGIDYALAPEATYPVALDQIEGVWKEVLLDGVDASKTVIMGDSAGGNLALSFALKLREEGLTQPGRLILLSPALDGTFSGPSYTENRSREALLTLPGIHFFMKAYTGGRDATDPFISPIFASLTGLPPLLVHVGSEELLFSDAQSIMEHAKRDGVNARLYVGEGMWHGWHLFADYAPEARKAMEDVAAYVRSLID